MNHDSREALSPNAPPDAPDDIPLDGVAVPAGPALRSLPQLALLKKQVKRKTFFDDLIRNLDMLVYIELAAIYYMDCSFIQILMRAFPQYLFLSPKPPNFPVPSYVQHRNSVTTLSVFNFLVFALHILSAAPSAGEAVRGYLHGGLLTDFVGQLGPTSKFRLGVMDLGVFLLQLTMLWLVVEKKELERAMEGGLETLEQRLAGTGRQDLDAEEQGVRRDAGNVEREEGIELMPLWGVGNDEEAENEDGNIPRRLDTEDHPFDAFYTGQYVVTDIHVLETVRRAWDWR